MKEYGIGIGEEYMGPTKQPERIETTVFPPMDGNGRAIVKPDLVPEPISVLGVLEMAVRQGANVETLTKLLDLRERMEATEARKAFVRAMAVFKSAPPTLTKSREVSFGQGKTSYKYTPLDECASIIGAALSKQGLSFRWETKQADTRISVTCWLQHEQGHSESVTLEGEKDTSGSKNGIQAIGSTVTYLERYTLLAITGMATANQDTDAVTNEEAADFIAHIEDSSTVEELERRSKEAITSGLKANSPNAVKLYMQARDKRKKALSAA